MQSTFQMSGLGAKRVFLLSALMLSYGITTTSAAFLRSQEASRLQTDKEEDPIPDPTCKRGVASPDLKVCCTDECGMCGTHKLCDNPGKFHEVTGKLADNCCKERILKKAVSCEKDHPPCVLSDSYKKELNDYEQKLPKRHAMQDCNKAVPKTYAVHELAVGKGEYLSKLYVEGKTKYEAAKAIAIKVEGLCKDKTKESEDLVAEYEGKIAGATDEDKVKDDTGVSKVDKWQDKVDDEKAETKFYEQLIKNAKEVEDAATAGIKNVEVLIGEVKDAKELDDMMLKLDALLEDAEVVHKDAEALWKQWNDSSKDYKCGQPPLVEHAKLECDNGNTKYARKCKIICHEGYDGNQSQNLLRCNRQGKFGKQLYGEWNGMSTCMGRVCGKPTQIKKAKTVVQDIRFPNVASYHCYEGFSVNGSASGDKVFDVKCGALGSFLEDAVAHQCNPISCGSAPVEKNTGPIDGEYHYTDIITYKCDKGHTIDETAGGKRSFSVSCQSTGEFNKGLSCRPVRCGKAPDFSNTKEPATKDEQYYGAELDFECRPGYSLDQQPGGATKFKLTCAENGEFEVGGGGATGGEIALPKCQPVSAGMPPAVPHGSFQRTEMFFGDTAWVTARTGYSFLGTPTDGLFFEISVNTEGKFEGYEKFLPVRCSKPPAIEKATASTGVMQRYGDVVAYECDSGYSTDKTASDAAKAFSVFCEADGYFSNIQKCKNIDDCIGHTCGPNGDCVDHLNNYTCDCESGFAPHNDNETKELVCGNIDDCGPEACGVGKCIDMVNDYKCDCPTGHEQKEILGEDGKAEKTCKAVLCGTPPEVDNSATVPAEAGQTKASYPEVVKYHCDDGHSLDGKASGEKGFEIDCQASKSFTPEKECKPIECNTVPKVDRASAKKSSATYNQSVRIDCDKGHTVDGSATGDKGFTVTCQATGNFGDVQQCKPIRCGVPDDIANTFRPSDSLVYADKVTYTCNEGFTLDSTPSGKTEYTVECLVDGTLTKTKECLPKVCGKIKDINALHITEFDVDHDSKIHYPGHVEVMCRDGYTVGGDPRGNRSFTVKCLSTGKFERYDKRECEPVICPVPPPMKNATLKAVLPGSTELDNPGNLNFEKKAVYECLEGFTAGGEPDAPVTFDVQCLPSGELNAPAPDMQCRNVNDCEHHTCGKKGTCVDLIGAAPAYTCDCEHGYEIQESGNGEKQCGNIDDCQGKDCGTGVCEDLIGDYTCICPSGHYVGFKDGSKTCLPVKCADEAPVLGNGKMLSSHSSGGVFFPESIRYKCDKGYSVDGSALASKRKFHAMCKADGGLFGLMSCQKLSCGSPHVLPYTTLVSPDAPTRSIEYDEKAKYKCHEGYTLTGTAGGATEFEVTCPDNGILSDPQVCLPVSCGTAPRVPRSKPGIAGEITYGMRLVYTCDVGYTLDSNVRGATEFRRNCQIDGTFGEQGATESEPCKPVSAGEAPRIDSAVLTEYDGRPANMEMHPTIYYPKGVEYRCLPGFSTTGSTSGATKITARVTSLGQLSPALPAECKEVSFSVSGIVKDARNGGRLGGVTVRVRGTSNSATTAGGYFTLEGVPPGDITLEYEKSGMIKTTKPINMRANIASGGAADVSMSPEMANDQWRVVLKWEARPRDLDSYMRWSNRGVTVYYGGRSKSSMGLRANLEVDKTGGHGPETVYLRNVGRCWGSGTRCDMTYEVNDYTRDGNMASTDVEVTVYSGSRVAGNFHISDCRGSVFGGGNWWKVFTIDGKTNQIKWTCAQSLNMVALNTTKIEAPKGKSTPAKHPLIARARSHA